MASIVALSALGEFDFHALEYQLLFAQSRTSAFQHPEWLSAFYRHLPGRPNAEPLIVAGRLRENDELVMILPLLRYTDAGLIYIEYAYGQVTDYALPILRTDFLATLGNIESFRSILHAAVGDHDVLRIEPVRESDTALWQRLFATPPQLVEFGAHSVKPQAPYLQWRSENLGTLGQLDRKTRRLSECGTLDLRVTSSTDVQKKIDLARQWREGRFNNDPLSTKAGFDFYCEVASRGAKSGFARTYTLSCGDDQVAIAFGIVDSDRFHYLLLGCNYDIYARYSPGILILDLMIADWLNSGGTVFDFTIGDEPFKNKFGCQRIPMYRFEYFN